MTTLAPAEKSEALALTAEDEMSSNAAIVQAAGYRLVPLAHPIGPWQI
jgi:hypothetical protein